MVFSIVPVKGILDLEHFVNKLGRRCFPPHPTQPSPAANPTPNAPGVWSVATTGGNAPPTRLTAGSCNPGDWLFVINPTN
jgi:hypothetical protein